MAISLDRIIPFQPSQNSRAPSFPLPIPPPSKPLAAPAPAPAPARPLPALLSKAIPQHSLPSQHPLPPKPQFTPLPESIPTDKRAQQPAEKQVNLEFPFSDVEFLDLTGLEPSRVEACDGPACAVEDRASKQARRSAHELSLVPFSGPECAPFTSDGDGGILETVEIPASPPLACSPAVPSTRDAIGSPSPLRSKTPADVTPGAASAAILIESDDNETDVEDPLGAIDRVHTEPLPDRRALESRAGSHDEDEGNQRIKGEPSTSPSLSRLQQVAVEIPVRRIASRSPSKQRPSAPTAREVDDNEGDGDSDYVDSEGEDAAAATASKRQKVATRPPSVHRAHPGSSSLAADAIVSLTLGVSSVVRPCITEYIQAYARARGKAAADSVVDALTLESDIISAVVAHLMGSLVVTGSIATDGLGGPEGTGCNKVTSCTDGRGTAPRWSEAEINLLLSLMDDSHPLTEAVAAERFPGRSWASVQQRRSMLRKDKKVGGKKLDTPYNIADEPPRTLSPAPQRVPLALRSTPSAPSPVSISAAQTSAMAKTNSFTLIVEGGTPSPGPLPELPPLPLADYPQSPIMSPDQSRIRIRDLKAEVADLKAQVL